MFPKRSLGSMLPSDYCFNRDNKGNRRHPRFLIWDGGRRYVFVGLDWDGDIPEVFAGAPRPGVGAGRLRRSRRSQSAPRRKTRRARPYLLDPQVCRHALASYNSDPAALRDEAIVYRKLAHGFQSGRILAGLSALRNGYVRATPRPRAEHDLAVIARAVEAEWLTFSELTGAAPDLRDRVCNIDVLERLFRLFLDHDYIWRHRSLATKALHFAAPQAFAPADRNVCNVLALGGVFRPWDTTDGLDARGMACWYRDYLEVLRDIGEDNPALIDELLEMDRAADDAEPPFFRRVRGLPKILDKIFWWAGSVQRHGRVLDVFTSEHGCAP